MRPPRRVACLTEYCVLVRERVGGGDELWRSGDGVNGLNHFVFIKSLIGSLGHDIER